MPSLTPLITAKDLRTALNPTTYSAIFDDDNSGDMNSVDASDQVKLCIRRAHTRVVSRLGVMYTKIPDGTDSSYPDLLVDAELNYAMGIAFDRHPEYVRTFGESDRRKACWDQAEATMELLQEAVLRLVDTPPEPVPRNVGGVVVDDGQHMFIGRSCGGGFNSGDF